MTVTEKEDRVFNIEIMEIELWCIFEDLKHYEKMHEEKVKGYTSEFIRKLKELNLKRMFI